MAWWKTGEGDDIEGDWPDDIVEAAMQQQIESAGPTIEMPALLRAWQDALNSEPRALLSDAAAAAYTLIAHTEPLAAPGPVTTVPAAAAPGDSAMRGSALEALRKIAQAYRDAAQRAPRTRELERVLASGLANPAEDGRFAGGGFFVKRVAIEAAGGAPSS